MLLSSVLQIISPLYFMACYMCQSLGCTICIADDKRSAEEKGGHFSNKRSSAIISKLGQILIHPTSNNSTAVIELK
jgi:hypothetical protein